MCCPWRKLDSSVEVVKINTYYKYQVNIRSFNVSGAGFRFVVCFSHRIKPLKHWSCFCCDSARQLM